MVLQNERLESMKKIVTTVVLGILLFAVPYAMAETVNLTTNEGEWGTATGGKVSGNFVYNGSPYHDEQNTVKYNDDKTIISWGIPSASGEGFQSAYGWDTSGTRSVNVNEAFVLGTFTHYNYPILSKSSSGPVNASITGVDLNLFLGDFFEPTAPFTTPLTFHLTFGFSHDETPAGDWVDGTYYDNQPDIVTISGLPVDQEFYYNGEIYYFSLLGFKDGSGYKFNEHFITDEGMDNSLPIYAIITTKPIELCEDGDPSCFTGIVPEPGSILLLGTGIIGLGFVVRRKLVKK